MNKLPLWRLTEGLPAYKDAESATALEQTYKVYKAMNELVDEYNKFSANLEKHINDYINSTTKDLDEFKIGLRQEFQDFIDVVDVKIDTMETTILAECTEEMNRYVQNEIKQMIHDLGQQEIDEIYDNFASEVATIKTDYLRKDEASTIYATKEEVAGQLSGDALNGYLTKEEAGNTYAKNADLTALEERVGTLEEIGTDTDGNSIDLSRYLTKTEASNLYATKSALTLLQNQVNTLSASITALEARIAELEENGTSGGNDDTGTGDSGSGDSGTGDSGATDPVEPEEPVEPEKITDLTGTTWVWNDSLKLPTTLNDEEFDITFRSCQTDWQRIKFTTYGTSKDCIMNYSHLTNGNEVDAFSEGTWSDTALKIIQITGGADKTNAILIDLLYQYATLQ